MTFQLNSRSFCITYSNVQQQRLRGSQPDATELESTFLEQPGLPIDEVTNLLRKWVSTRTNAFRIPLEYLLVAREQHESGEIHFHVAIQFVRNLRTRDPRIFDINGVHPNLQSAKDFDRWVAYCKKDGEYSEWGTIAPKKAFVRVSPEELIELAKTMNKASFLSYCSVHKYPYASEIWRLCHKLDDCTLQENSYVAGTMDKCLDTLGDKWDRTKCLLLVGPSGIGKTTWCKINLPKPCLMVTHLDDLKRFEPGIHTSILFDDVSVKHLPDTSQIHLVDHHNPRSIHIRYGTARIPAGIVKAFTCNTIPVNLDMEAIARRCHFIHVINYH